MGEERHPRFQRCRHGTLARAMGGRFTTHCRVSCRIRYNRIQDVYNLSTLDHSRNQEDDDPLEPDELPEHLRPPPSIDMGSVDASNPENILKLSKKGRTLMSFVSVNGNPTREETEDITKLWQTSLWNNHIQAERYLIDDNRAIFMFKDGAQAWEAKDFLVEQDRCLHVSIENKEYKGKHNRDEL